MAVRYCVANEATHRTLGYDLMPGMIRYTQPHTWATYQGASRHADRLNPAPMGQWKVYRTTERGNVNLLDCPTL